MYSDRGEGGKENEGKDGKWNINPITLELLFTITLEGRDTQINITFETETDIMLSDSSDYSTVNGSISFNYPVETNYVSTLYPDWLTAGVYISGLGITVSIIAMAARKIVPEEPV
jgi:hypothetical protein